MISQKVIHSVHSNVRKLLLPRNTRKTIIAFGTIFNDIHIRHRDGSGKETNDMRVPLAYDPMQKFPARLEQQPDLNRAVQITLPRMSFETTNIAYDATRKA